MIKLLTLLGSMAAILLLVVSVSLVVAYVLDLLIGGSNVY